MQAELTFCHSNHHFYDNLEDFPDLDETATMIRCHLARMMGEHKMRIADVARETGLSRATVALLYKETAQKVNLAAIEKLCLLFDCQVGDLLEHVQEK